MSARLLPGDIVLVRSESLVSRLIRLVTRGWREPRTRASHCEIVVTGGDLAAAVVVSADRGGVTQRTIPDLHRGKWITVYRPRASELWRMRAAYRAFDKRGQKYPVWRLIGHLLDWLAGLGVIEVYLFRRVMRSSRVMHCSELVAWAYWPVVQFGAWPWAVTPDDIDDICSVPGHSDVVCEPGILL